MEGLKESKRSQSERDQGDEKKENGKRSFYLREKKESEREKDEDKEKGGFVRDECWTRLLMRRMSCDNAIGMLEMIYYGCVKSL